jgi:sodium-dependent dicarboxylate transporter 2/3/5
LKWGGRHWLCLALAVAAVFGSLGLIRDARLAGAAILVALTVVLWLTEVIPAWVTSMALVAATPIVLGQADPEFSLPAVLSRAADPIMALFFGGFSLAVASSRHGLDEYVAERALALARGRRRRFLALIMIATAVLSMWMSNIAAAAMMLAALSPHLDRTDRNEPYRRALLLGVAVGANLGGMATPVGTGPNGIAIAELAPWVHVTFLKWMALALPITLGMLLFGFLLIAGIHRVRGRFQPIGRIPARLTVRGRGLLAVFALAATAWLTESVHGVPAPLVAIAVAAILFGGGWLAPVDLRRIDWSTMALIAGGLVLGYIVEHSGLLAVTAARVHWDEVSAPLRVLGLVGTAAFMSALMSNTASAAILIPFGLGLGAPHSIAVLIAIGSSFGMPFVISTPPNAMVYGRGGLDARDLLAIGLPIMLVGCLVVALTGPVLLRWFGLP